MVNESCLLACGTCILHVIQLLGVRRPVGALVRRECHGPLLFECFSTTRRRAAAGQSGDRSRALQRVDAYFKELTVYLETSVVIIDLQLVSFEAVYSLDGG